MKRTRLLALALIGAFTAIMAGSAWTDGGTADGRKMLTLLVLDSQAGSPYEEVRLALLQGLARRGYRDGKNLKVLIELTGNDVPRGERILRKYREKEVDVVFAGGTAAALAARNVLRGKGVPVVFGGVTDPVGLGLVPGFTMKPGGTFTGVCYPVPVKARLRFIRQLMPKARTFGLIYADMPQSRSYRKWLEDLLAHDPEFSDIRILFRSVPLVTGDAGDRAMADAALPLVRELDGRVDAFIKSCDQLGSRRYFSEMAFANATKPLVGLVRSDVMDGWGATATMFPSHASIGSQAATMVADILGGRTPGEIVPQWPRKYGFAVDLPKAKRFGISVPVELLELAGENIIR